MEPQGERPQLQSVRTAVIGASGYSGQELLRYLARHPVFQLTLVTSRQNAGQPLSQLVHGLPRQLGELILVDVAPDFALAEKADLFFLAVPHGLAAPYVTVLREAGKTVVDLSADFRTTDPAVYEEFYGHEHPAPFLLKEAVYGIPEIHRAQLATTKLIAAPGCFPTSIILPLVPFLRAGWIEPDSIVVTSLSGVSGAGRKLEMRLLFGEINDNMYAYGVPTARLTQSRTDDEVQTLLQEQYGNQPFVEVLPATALPEARQVAHSNRIQIAGRIDARTNRLLLFSSLDNLGKGNASQAIQAANIATGLEETLGLV
jgi:N-acetyl-gamma-glutamyl-phosphate reductase